MRLHRNVDIKSPKEKGVERDRSATEAQTSESQQHKPQRVILRRGQNHCHPEAG